MNNTVHDEEVNNCVVCVVLAENRLLLKKQEVLFKKSSVMHLKMYKIVHLHCHSSLLVVCKTEFCQKIHKF